MRPHPTLIRHLAPEQHGHTRTRPWLFLNVTLGKDLPSPVEEPDVVPLWWNNTMLALEITDDGGRLRLTVTAGADCARPDELTALARAVARHLDTASDS